MSRREVGIGFVHTAQSCFKCACGACDRLWEHLRVRAGQLEDYKGVCASNRLCVADRLCGVCGLMWRSVCI